jgi:rRNA maturation RNase YbeY
MIKTIPPQIQFHYLLPVSLSQRNNLKSFLVQLFKAEKKKLSSLTYIFCSDEYLLEMNKYHLQHDFYTDIITFDLSQHGTGITGEIYISTDRVRDNAQNLNESFKKELHRVIFHGALHLCGYKDKTQQEEITMRKMEDKYLGLYFQ